MKIIQHMLTFCIRKLRKVNIFPRILFVFCVLLIIPTVFITFFNQHNYATETEKNNLKYLSMLVQNANFKIEQEMSLYEGSASLFTQNDSALIAVKKNEKIQEEFQENKQIIQSALSSIQNNMDGIKALLFIAENNQYSVEKNMGYPSEVYIRDVEAFYNSEIYTKTVAAKGYPVWSDATKDTPTLIFENENDKLGIIGCITLSYQVYDPHTKDVLGTLIYCIYPDHFAKILKEYSSKDKGNTFLVGENGLIEGINATTSAPPFPRLHDGLLEQIFSEHQGDSILESENRELLVSFSGSPDLPIHVVNLSYRDYILQKVNWLSRLNLWLLIFILFVGVLGFYLATISISKPIKELIGATKRAGLGDLSAINISGSHDEVGVLCQEFDKMVSDMKKLIDEVYIAEIRQKTLQLNEKNAQLDALQMQINPHFLYNTLDMIRWQCLYENNGESGSSEMIEKFCTLLRMTTKGNENKETLDESIACASIYLEVMNFRYTNKIVLETYLLVNPEHYKLPYFALQPIIENSIKHAFSDKEVRTNRISIKALLNKYNQLIIYVIDNGEGMPQDKLDSIRRKIANKDMSKNNIGLQNVNQRCKLFYGDDYGLEIDSHLGQGTTVTLTIPIEFIEGKGGVIGV